MTDADPDRHKPKAMDPAEAEELARSRDFSADEVAEVLKKRREKEKKKAQERFGDREPFPYPDTDTDS
jgi:hypothetical protein